MKKRYLVLLPVLVTIILFSCSKTGRKSYNLISPGKSAAIDVSLGDGGQLFYSVSFGNSKIIKNSKLGLNLKEGGYLGDSLKMVAEELYEADETYPVIAGKSSTARNHYNGVRITFRETKAKGRIFILDMRAYDDGVSFRYAVPGQDVLEDYSLVSEETRFAVDTTLMAWPIQFDSFKNNYEDHYKPVKVGKLGTARLTGVPFVFTSPGKYAAAITEAELVNYAGMYLKPSAGDPSSLGIVLPPNPEHPGLSVFSKEGLTTPWRVVMLASSEAGLISSDIIINLNEPDKIKDTDWIKPGLVAWDWWNGQVVKGKGFEGKMDDRTMEYFIDFASGAGLEYMLIDAGWYGNHRDGSADITKTIPEINMEHLVSYAKERNVGLLLWVNWKSLDNQLNEALSLYQKWGIRGIKVDYMDADNQPMVDYYHRVVKAAAAHHLLVDFHGAYKPTGIRRTWPNLMTREGILGMEYLKWSSKAGPEHNVTIPFTRMLVGPMDYTPGGFNQVVKEAFDSVSIEPKALGTRSHQLAMYVVYESPLQMVSDHPAAYTDQPGFEFIEAVPSTWDETYPVDGRISDYIIMARRKGTDWYVGGMTDWTPRTLTFKTNFLEAGKDYHMELFRDAGDSDVHPKNLVTEERDLTGGDEITLGMAPGGGFAIRITLK